MREEAQKKCVLYTRHAPIEGAEKLCAIRHHKAWPLVASVPTEARRESELNAYGVVNELTGVLSSSTACQSSLCR